PEALSARGRGAVGPSSVRTKARGEALAVAAGRLGRGSLPAVVVLRPGHIYDDTRAGDPLVPLLRRTPPLRLGTGEARMSMVSVPRLVDAMLAAARGAEALRGRSLALRELDANFQQFYQERLLGRRLVGPVVPAWALLLAARAADAWCSAGGRLWRSRLCGACRRRAGGPGAARAAGWGLVAACLFERDPLRCFTEDGMRQMLLHLSLDDSATPRDLRA
ncbi:unnamed protein product, partial [Prorocentrum cordatum]